MQIAVPPRLVLAVLAALVTLSSPARSDAERDRMLCALRSVSVSDEVLAHPALVSVNLALGNCSGEDPVSGEVWVHVRGHPLSDRKLRSRKARAFGVPIALAPGELRTEIIQVSLPSWADGPMQVCVAPYKGFKYPMLVDLFVSDPNPGPCGLTPGQGVPFRPLLAGQGYGVEVTGLPAVLPQERVIRTEDEWAAFLEETGMRVPLSWGRNTDPGAPVEMEYARPFDVDFTKETLLAMFKGVTTASELFAGLRVRDVRLTRDGRIVCRYKVTHPRERDLTGFPDDFSPFLVVTVPKSDAPVEFMRVR
jgi:hypothetical protein